MRGMGQMGQSLLLRTLPGYLGLEVQGAARSPAAIPFSSLASAPPSEDLAGSPTETHGAQGAPCTLQPPWGLCPRVEASPPAPSSAS